MDQQNPVVLAQILAHRTGFPVEQYREHREGPQTQRTKTPRCPSISSIAQASPRNNITGAERGQRCLHTDLDFLCLPQLDRDAASK